MAETVRYPDVTVDIKDADIWTVMGRTINALKDGPGQDAVHDYKLACTNGSVMKTTREYVTVTE